MLRVTVRRGTSLDRADPVAAVGLRPLVAPQPIASCRISCACRPGRRSQIRDFYLYWEGLQEAWDGPALLVWSDGKRVGACLDRNGLRPARYMTLRDGTVFMMSETGVIPVDEAEVRTSPGEGSRGVTFGAARGTNGILFRSRRQSRPEMSLPSDRVSPAGTRA